MDVLASASNAQEFAKAIPVQVAFDWPEYTVPSPVNQPR
jgi:hypothetical protein